MSQPENLVVVNANSSEDTKTRATKKHVIKPLPPVSAFKFNSILSHCEDEATQLTDCIQNIAAKYRHDLSCEVDEVKKAQIELVRRMDEVDTLLIKTATQINVNIQQYKSSKHTLKSVEKVSEECEQTYHRLDSIINHLYSIESKLPYYERLGTEKSPHKQHYPVLHRWMRANDQGDTNDPSSSSSPSPPYENSNEADTSIDSTLSNASQVPLSKIQERSLQTIKSRDSTDQLRPSSSQSRMSRDSRESRASSVQTRRALNTKAYPSHYPRPMISLMSSTSHVSTTVCPIEPQTLFEEAIGVGSSSTIRTPRRMVSIQSMRSLNSAHLPLMEADSVSTISRAATIKSSFSLRGIADFLKGSPKKKMTAEQRLRGFL